MIRGDRRKGFFTVDNNRETAMGKQKQKSKTTYIGYVAPPDSDKQHKAGRVDHGGTNYGDVGRYAASHMSVTPRGPTWGKSAKQSRTHLDAKGAPEPTGPFVQKRKLK